MKKLNNGYIKLAIQKKGRLTDSTIALLRSAGLEFESYQQKLFAACRNFPLNIVYLRDDDIPDYVEKGAVDLGIVGDNIVIESGSRVNKILSLPYGYCTLSLAVPKESKVNKLIDLEGKRIATSYTKLALQYLKKNNIQAELIRINGSVEIAPALQMSDAIIDFVSTGSTMLLNDLRVIEKIYESQAMLISKASLSSEKMAIIQKLLLRLKGVLAADNYKYVMMNAPSEIVKIIQTIVPGLKAPTISRLSTPGWISIQTVIQEDVFWETIEKLKDAGATGILVLPVEKLIL